MKRIVTKKYAQIIPDDGYADGGEPYTDEEMDHMNKKPSPSADINSRPITMPPRIKKTLSNGVADILRPTRFEQIPLKEIFNLFELHHVMAIQEDGTSWSGFLLGDAECGDDRTRDQVVHFPLAIDTGSEWKVTTTHFHLSWCRMPSGKKEVIGYIS